MKSLVSGTARCISRVFTYVLDEPLSLVFIARSKLTYSVP